MAKKKVLNVGKVMVIVGAIIIMVLVALWCGSLLKLTHDQKKPSNANPVSMQSTMSVNVIVPPVTTTTTISTEPPQTTLYEEIPTDTTTTTTQSGGAFREYLIRLANPELSIYAEPSYNSAVAGVITDRGSYTITKETIDDNGNKWGYIDSESTFGWINLQDARKTDPLQAGSATTTVTTGTNTGTTTTTADENDDTYDYDNNNYYGYNSEEDYYIGVDADGDGIDDGWNPEAWCIICGYDSYWNDADECYYCSQGHAWNY
ncbi:MAG: hypothetical protein K2G36_02025 [Ruminococcus sp.]|nr:hypothetical protein [Ruminococcus sp.]